MKNIRLCENETSETIYWLEIIGLIDGIKISVLEELMKEAKELLDLFTSIGVPLNNNSTTPVNPIL